jgi:hypothetical protein
VSKVVVFSLAYAPFIRIWLRDNNFYRAIKPIKYNAIYPLHFSLKISLISGRSYAMRAPQSWQPNEILRILHFFALLFKLLFFIDNQKPNSSHYSSKSRYKEVMNQKYKVDTKKWPP